MHQGYSLFHRKPPPKFEIEALFRLVILYTDKKKKHTSFIVYQTAVKQNLNTYFKHKFKRTHYRCIKLLILKLPNPLIVHRHLYSLKFKLIQSNEQHTFETVFMLFYKQIVLILKTISKLPYTSPDFYTSFPRNSINYLNNCCIAGFYTFPARGHTATAAEQLFLLLITTVLTTTLRADNYYLSTFVSRCVNTILCVRNTWVLYLCRVDTATLVSIQCPVTTTDDRRRRK
ncbi:hypothetical protein AGLY_005337 [Aphis glycines]|uniref:Uncharacterized protein n=1 Tax=Aphis glycines TaxID=307491 RepID=A0A6G0TWF0_APHGL|nr:hypothetical protein AGLY_005337 [Aphis glycines]